MHTSCRKIRTGLRRSPSSKHPRRHPPLPKHPNETLKSFAAGDPSAALRHLLSSSNPDYPSCSSVLYRLARSRLFTELDTLLLFIRSHRIPCPNSLFSALIRHFSLASFPHRALRLFFSIPSFNCSQKSPSLHTFNHLLDALVNNGCHDESRRLLDRCSEFGLRANHVSYNIVMKGRLRRDEYDGARQVFDEMRQRGVRPSVVSYNMLIGFAGQNGDLSKAMSLKEEMVKQGIDPNCVTYALLMKGLCSSNNYVAARKLMFDMEYHGCKTKAANFGVLMSDCGRRGDFDEMKELLAEMRRRKMKPDEVIYSILVNYLCANGRTDEAYKVLVEMEVREGLRPSAAVYRMMVDGFCKVQDFERGLGVLNAMLVGGHCPRLETFGALVLGLAGGGRMEEVWFVLEEMERRKMGSGLGLGAWRSLVEGACGEFHGGGDELLRRLTLKGFAGGDEG
ncbi:pentatricopeptide repeat-containing protein At1g07740, mitochondrial-like [Phalaenopsis equestris]|uniref:pentatricopeptide repeat-containing protein At1g07740, mitochondrial-like n=1 Tax=Phalaenopsis equestris TaxID=78828 RepID=UPI0009E5F365|nr:pentatricopeptide repeat-containing protein At1g07740, mitochondrial-like [Phalaenopsis equestris]